MTNNNTPREPGATLDDEPMPFGEQDLETTTWLGLGSCELSLRALRMAMQTAMQCPRRPSAPNVQADDADGSDPEWNAACLLLKAAVRAFEASSSKLIKDVKTLMYL